MQADGAGGADGARTTMEVSARIFFLVGTHLPPPTSTSTHPQTARTHTLSLSPSLRRTHIPRPRTECRRPRPQRTAVTRVSTAILWASSSGDPF
jgi:hypothetical protein